MAPFRGTPLLSRLVVLALLAWVSGLAPFLAQSAHARDAAPASSAYQDPCDGCPDEEESELPCSPVCADCFCGPGTRLSTERPSPSWELVRVLQPMPSAGPVSSSLAPPQDPALDGLLRPPRP